MEQTGRRRRLDRVGEFRTAFEKNRKIILASQNVCALCGYPVDPGYKYPHPMSATVDHIIPIAKGGHPSDIENLQLAHRCCNQQKRDKIVTAKFMQEKIENAQIVNNDDLEQHFDWANYISV